ncbi:hypothetical protein [Hansschlegelia plantiphila]|uniref:Uncharacterized protein n=1 Tax=Hansschlegelia plantiphila TaxID=374655 RepID=A0A9W6J0G9_9HYPH|nr:hypothetical protein [Hansschlegelia plantiphila]GLK67010.1 hypothetical protein GCM10008179_06480 [Hansschlegelia plantiphila]
MSVRSRIDAIDLDVRAIVDEELSPKAQSRQIANFARQQLAEAQEINRQALGRVPDHVTIVDGRANAPVDTVRPDGVIVFAFELLDDLFSWIAEQLVRHAPVLTGAYRESFVFLADGVAVPAGVIAPAAEEYVFLSPLPYARKIERGLSSQAPDGVFQVVADLAKRRFGNMAHIRFSYRAFGDAGFVPYAPALRLTSRNRKGQFASDGRDRTAQKHERDLRRPAIVIAPRG